MENWKRVVGYEGMYDVSDQGGVRSLDRFVAGRSGSMRKLKGRVLVPYTDPRGYKSVHICRDKLIKVYRLVAIAFIPNPYSKKEVNHIDGNPLNNNVSNLEWATHQ